MTDSRNPDLITEVQQMKTQLHGILDRLQQIEDAVQGINYRISPPETDTESSDPMHTVELRLRRIDQNVYRLAVQQGPDAEPPEG